MSESCCGGSCSRRTKSELAAILGAAGGLALVLGFVAGVTATPDTVTAAQAAPDDELKPVPTDPSVALEKAKREGDTVDTEFKLKNAKGEELKLAQLLEKGPIVLIFYRGSWCPVCQASLTKFEAAAADIEAAGARVYAVTPELTEYLQPTVEKHGYERVHLMSDPDLRLGRELGVAWKNEQYGHLAKFNGNDRREIPLGVTYVIKQDGTIAWSWLDDDYRQRADPADVIKAVQALKG